MGVATAIVAGGVAASAAGSYMSAKSANKANQRAAEAAAYKPFQVAGLGAGSVGISDLGNRFNVRFHGSDALQSVQDQALANAQRAIDPLTGELQESLDATRAQGILQTPEMIAQAQELGFDPAQLNAALNQAGTSGARSEQLSGMLQGRALAAQAAGPQNVAEANFLKGRGHELLNTNFDQQRDQQLALLREQAAPFEQQQMSNFQADLFKRGMLNDSSGSGLLAQQFGTGLARADLDRQQAAIGLGNQLTQQDRQLGQGLFNQGIGTSFASTAAQDATVQGNAGAAGNLGMQAFNLGDAATTTGLNFGQANINNAQRRIANAESMFNFAQSVDASRGNIAGQQLGMFSNIDADKRATIGLSGQLAGGAAAAGANQASFLSQNRSVTGPLLSSFGQGMMSMGMGA